MSFSFNKKKFSAGTFWSIGDKDDYFSDLIQVNSEEEADQLNDELKWNNFSSATNPMIASSSGKEVIFKNI